MSRSLIKASIVGVLLKRATLVRRVFLKEIYRFSSDLVINHRLRIDPSCESKLKGGTRHRKHPGIQTLAKVMLPVQLADAIDILIEKYPIKDLKTKSEQLVKYLWSRHVPLENEVVMEKSSKLELEILKKEGVDLATSSVEENQKLQNKVKSKVLSALKKEVYHWKPIKYDAYLSYQYAVGRLAFDYSSALQIFSEIAQRTDFCPQTVFHFGSGVGSTVWAGNSVWPETIHEHFCCDSSDDMNTLARLLLQGGKEEAEMCIPGVYFRQYLPPSQKTKYDLVVSAFSLNELLNKEERMKTVNNLWMKTKQFLVVVENGTNAGFSLVNEARDFVLEMNKTGEGDGGNEENSSSVHVFAPCAHDKICPRMSRQDGTPCNFEIDFQNISQFGKKDVDKARISYVVLRRGSRESCQTGSWPRIVRPVSTPSKRVHLRTCTPAGQLEYSIVTAAKHGRDLFWCARASQWGDLLPVLSQSEKDETPTEHSVDESCHDDAANDTIESLSSRTEDKTISNLNVSPDVV